MVATLKADPAAGREQPDDAEARRRLGDIYLDDKEDYDAAIAEFETVLALPENQQLIYKQFAVTFTNLGHAYCEKGNRLVASDRRRVQPVRQGDQGAADRQAEHAL